MLFSVIIPTYNRAHLISNAIISVLNQTFQDFELIIIDDGSTDNTKQIIETFRSDKINYIFQENAERSAARNNGINNAKGQYICFLDSDDYYLLNRLELLHSFISKAKTKNVFFVTDMSFEINNKVKPSLIKLPLSNREFEKVLLNNVFCQQVCVYSNILKENLFNKDLTIGEDTELWIRIFKKQAPVYIPNQNTVVIIEHDERSINWKKKNFSKKLLKMLHLVFAKEHSGEDISLRTKKFCYSNTYFGIAKHHIWNNNRISGFYFLIKSIFSDLKNEQIKYKINILINLLVKISKSKKLIEL